MSLIDIGLSFSEGLALIVSPCILPVLPLVLAASADGGRRRPYGIIIGFVLAFSLFALASRKIVLALGLDLEIIKQVSLVLLALFGLVLLSAKLSEKFSALTQGAANFGNQLASKGGDGLLSGVLIGALIGLVWTPCAGPILAAVLVQVIRQQSDLAGDLVIVAFAIGAGVPMLIIALFGRRFLKKLGWFTRHAEAVRRGFGVLILLSVTWIASGGALQTLLQRQPDSPPGALLPASSLMLEQGLKQPYPAPEFSGITAWLNSKPLTMQSLKGKVVLVDFWTFSCINCIRTLPYITDWDRKYRDQGLVIVGVHAPEFEFEKNIDNVKSALLQNRIHYPVALDNQLTTWGAFNNQYWPAHYLIDRDGKVVYTHFGEGDYNVTENNIRYLLGLKTAAASAPALAAQDDAQTPETYLGNDRADSYAGAVPVALNDTRAYRFPPHLQPDHWALAGGWKVGAEHITAVRDRAALRLSFKARKVFLVMGSASGKPIKVNLRLNGAPPGTNAGKDFKTGSATIGRNTLYELIDQHTSQRGLLEIQSATPGLQAYAFTFG